LGISGEAVFRVPSLQFPDPEHVQSILDLEDYRAVQLLIERTRQIVPNYKIASHNAVALARICQRLDGIPLALELAAARLGLLSAEQLADRLDDVFSLLRGGSLMGLPRHRTLLATIDWSYHLLTEQERCLLRRLSVFAGGCTLEAAEEVCSDGGLVSSDILEVITALIAKSMVTAERRQGAGARFYMLETVRQYAQEKLQQAGDAARWQTRHRDYFLSFIEIHVSKVKRGEKPYWIQNLTTEQDNLRQALTWSFRDESDVEAGPRLVVATFSGPWKYQETLSWFKLNVAWCQRHPSISKRLHARALVQASLLMAMDDPPTGLTWAAQAVELCRQLEPDDQVARIWSLSNLANVGGNVETLPEAQVLAPFNEAEAMLLALPPDHYTPREWLLTRANYAAQRSEFAIIFGHYQEAKQYARDSLRLEAEAGKLSPDPSSWIFVGIACVNLAEFEEARSHLLYALSLVNNEPESSFMRYNLTAYAQRWLADLALRQDELEKALGYCHESLRQADQIPDYNIIASNLGLLAAISARQGQPTRAARLSGASAAMYTRQKRRRWEDSALDTLMPGWQVGPEAAVIQHEYEIGQGLSADQAIAYGLGKTEVSS
jgi:predicted ATPase